MRGLLTCRQLDHRLTMRILVLGLGLIVAMASTASARSPAWRGPGWYIVTGTSKSGTSIRDGRFPSSGACYEELSREVAMSRKGLYRSDSCISLAQDLDDASQMPAQTASLETREAPVAASYGPRPAPAPATLHRFASLKLEGVTVRSGPSAGNSVSWVYLRKGWPVEVLAQQGQWRNIRDRSGQTGWVEAAALDDARTGVLIGDRMQAIRAWP